jgi:hypothetical protein
VLTEVVAFIPATELVLSLTIFVELSTCVPFHTSSTVD